MKNKRGATLISLGLLLIAAALFLAGYNLYDGWRASRSVGQVLDRLDALTEESAAGESGELEIPDYVLNPGMDMPVQTIDGQDYIGVLRIPALGLELPVMSEWSYPRLKIAPCRYSGSAYAGNFVIAGHNYPAHFGGLKALREGDAVTFTDMDGNVFTYEVVINEVLNPDATEEMENGDWDLTLFTCTVGGQTRVTVRFELKGE